jgi:DNA-binding GntR family transcriptional regulator
MPRPKSLRSKRFEGVPDVPPAGNRRRTRAAPAAAPRSAIVGLIDPKLPIAPQVSDILRRGILTLSLKPSEGLSEQEIASALAVSRTPVREALIKLAEEGLIDILPQRGSFVAPIRLAEVIEAQFIREVLESAVVRRAAFARNDQFVADLNRQIAEQSHAVKAKNLDRFLELDEDFHRAMSESVGLNRSWRLIQNVKTQMDRVRYLSLPEPGHLNLLLEQHAEIVRAIQAKNPDAAETGMRVHLQEVFRSIEALAKQGPEMFVR